MPHTHLLQSCANVRIIPALFVGGNDANPLGANMNFSPRSDHDLEIFLLGPPTVLDRSGNQLTPKNQKSKAVVAMLALAPRGSRSRVWLRDKLWSDRSEDQASASLRQALLDIRKSFGADYKDILIADKYSVTLDLSRVQVDAKQISEQADKGLLHLSDEQHDFSEHFLEGFDICDPEFESWLTLERQIWDQRFEKTHAASGGDGYGGVPAVEHLSEDPSKYTPALNTPAPGPNEASRASSSADGTWAIGLQDVSPTQPCANALQQKLMRNLHEMGRIPVLRTNEQMLSKGLRQVTLPLAVRVTETSLGENVRLTVELVSTENGITLWTSSQTFTQSSFLEPSQSNLNAIVSQTVIQIGRLLQTTAINPDIARAGVLIECIYQIFGLSEDHLYSADKKLEMLLKHQPNAQTYAWMAFSKSFQVGQRFSADAAAQISEAQYFATRALEEDEYDPLVLSLAAHIHSYLFSEFDLAASLYERALKLDPEQTLGWDLYATLNAYCGHNSKALAMASWAQQLGANTPISYYFDTTKCIAATLAGDHRSAVAAGERALVQRPKFNSILRYLISSHAHLGNVQMLESLRQRLNDVEPDFSAEVLRGSGYPGLGTEGGLHFLQGLRKAGLD
jgi:tetratricopeptide (TPR) repeat protein